jgi:predicted O-methyltransferase YrrM
MTRTIEELLIAAPAFQRDQNGRPVKAHLGEEALLYILKNAAPGSRTLETGAGYSTIAFALARTHHTAITPVQAEVDAIRSFCAEQGIDLGAVEFIVDESQSVLPRLTGDLDAVLIDGSHAFPGPIIDWYYAARLLRVGGFMLLDDNEIWSVRTLTDFLKQDPSWRFEAGLSVGRTPAFLKVAASPQRSWLEQPFVRARSDLSLVLFSGNRPPLKSLVSVRTGRDLVLRAVRTAAAYGNHLRAPGSPPPFRRSRPLQRVKRFKD